LAIRSLHQSRDGRSCIAPAEASQAKRLRQVGVHGVRLTVNGEMRDGIAAASVAGLIAELGLDGRKVAIERNLEIVPRSLYADTALADGDRIEIVHFIGGG
jgi:thiamine biosynthesis protein ThiS